MGLFEAVLGALASSFDPSDYDWWCDDCDASLNDQPGFSPDCGSWTCTECGCLNFIDADNVRDDDYDEDHDSVESLNVWDAAEIWASNGKDEDYMFGYSEEELEAAL